MKRHKRSVPSRGGGPARGGRIDTGLTDPTNTLSDPATICYALSTLASPHRAVVIRAYYLGWTTRQIAAELNIAEPEVKSRLHDALRDLRLTFIELAQRSASPATGAVAGPAAVRRIVDP